MLGYYLAIASKKARGQPASGFFCVWGPIYGSMELTCLMGRLTGYLVGLAVHRRLRGPRGLV